MKQIRQYFAFFFSFFLFSCHTEKHDIVWTIVLEQPGKEGMEMGVLPQDLSNKFSLEKEVDGIKVSIETSPKNGYTVLKATATSVKAGAACFLSLKAKYVSAEPWNYDGEVSRTEIYRQSPHDVNAWITDSLAKQAMPMVALKTKNGFVAAISNAPVFYNNYTTQQFNLSKSEIILSSGDNGLTPGMVPATMKMGAYNAEKGQKFTPGTVNEYYHDISADNPHIFEAIIISNNVTDLKNLRKDIVLKVSDHFSQGKYSDYMGALAFTVPYMNVRLNDSKKSTYWVIPSVEYSNQQYCRDAFWISTMLPDSIAAQCLKNELDSVNHYAEYPLFIPIWAYRTIKAGGHVDLQKVQAYVDIIETHIKNGYYYSYDSNDGRKDFQYWNDCIAFDTADVITHNQGLLCSALLAARELGLQIKTSPELAIKNYQNLFNSKLGFLPLSKLKDTILSPDVLTGDLLAQLYFNKPLLNKEIVQLHYNKIVEQSKTNYGYKIVAGPDGNYLNSAAYDWNDYISQVNKGNMQDGQYQRGGSWTLYDMLFLIDAYLYGIKGVEDEIIWRSSLDYKIGATSYECINTKTGEPWKPNMGWNVAIYSFWKQLVNEKKADDKLFNSIHKIVQ